MVIILKTNIKTKIYIISYSVQTFIIQKGTESCMESWSWDMPADQCMTRSRGESQCLLFFAFLWERCGDRDLDLPAFRFGDGDRERLDHLGDLVLLNVQNTTD